MKLPESWVFENRDTDFLFIDRRFWLRGSSISGNPGEENFNASSELFRREDSKLCCLGFRAIQTGISVNRINSVACPSEVQGRLPKSFRELLKDNRYVDSEITTDLMKVNDTKVGYRCDLLGNYRSGVRKGSIRRMTEKLREKKIAEIFKKHFNVHVEFVN
jgi:hypothetical protein